MVILESIKVFDSLKDLPFETLEVEAKVALEIFQHNK